MNHDDRIRRHYPVETANGHPIAQPEITADAKIEALMADMRGTIYVDKLDIWHIRQLARALVRKGWLKDDIRSTSTALVRVEPQDRPGAR